MDELEKEPRPSITLAPEVVRSIAELQKWFVAMPDAEKFHLSNPYLTVRVFGEVSVRVFADSIDIEYL